MRTQSCIPVPWGLSSVVVGLGLVLASCSGGDEDATPVTADATSTGPEVDTGPLLEGHCDNTDPTSNLVADDGDCDGLVFDDDCDDSDPEVARECLQLSAGSVHACLVEGPGRVECWGNDSPALEPLLAATPPDQRFQSVASGSFHACGLTTEGAVVCWGDNAYGQCDSPVDSAPFTSLSAGIDNTCGLTADGAIVCWGETFMSSGPPVGAFKSIDIADNNGCGVAMDGSVSCWGHNAYGEGDPPEGSFQSVSAGHYAHSCGVRTDGSLACWGGYEGLSDVPEGTFQSVSVGYWHACAIRTDGTILCWEESKFDVHVPPPTGLFRSIGAGNYFTCAVSMADEIECWGDEEWGIPSPP